MACVCAGTEVERVEVKKPPSSSSSMSQASLVLRANSWNVDAFFDLTLTTFVLGVSFKNLTDWEGKGKSCEKNYLAVITTDILFKLYGQKRGENKCLDIKVQQGQQTGMYSSIGTETDKNNKVMGP